MVRVSPAKYPRTLFIPGYEGMPELELNDYWIDQYEVTNPPVQGVCRCRWISKTRVLEVRFRPRRQASELGRGDGAVPRRGRTSRTQRLDSGGISRRARMITPSLESVGTKPRRMPSSPARACPRSITGTAPPGRFLASYIVPASNFGSTGIVARRQQAGRGAVGHTTTWRAT